MSSPVVESLYDQIWSRKSPGSRDNTLSLREELALQWLTPAESFLDIGCGTGELCRKASHKFTSIQGCDISNEALSIAKQNGISCQKVDLNESILPYDAGSFDAVTALDVIEHLFDPPTFLILVHQILKPGGQLILSTPNFRKLKNLLILAAHGHFPKTSGDPEGWDGGHFAYFTRKDLSDLLIRSGFTPSRSLGIYSLYQHQTLKKIAITLLGKYLSTEFIAGGILIEAIASPRNSR